jgi:transcriptional regulator with XRE-family HTH domain
MRIMSKAKLLNIILKRIGALLVDLRIKKGYNTIKEFVAAYDLPMIQYWRIENGKTNLTMKTLVHILAIHRIAVEDFFVLLKESNWK